VTLNEQVTGSLGVRTTDTLDPLIVPPSVPPLLLLMSANVEAHVPVSAASFCEMVTWMFPVPATLSFVVPTHVPATEDIVGPVGVDEDRPPQATDARKKPTATTVRTRM
jgi:hypothetical protein